MPSELVTGFSLGWIKHWFLIGLDQALVSHWAGSSTGFSLGWIKHWFLIGLDQALVCFICQYHFNADGFLVGV